MKILLYTISDFKPMALECIDLLISSARFDVPTHFAIVSNKLPQTEIKYSIILDTKIQSNYIGALKYSNVIPKDYDYYIYLDSDILYFDKISKLIDTDYDYSLVRENYKVANHPWHYFDRASESDKPKLQAAEALNAGSFAFSAEKLYNINEAYALCNQYCVTEESHINAQNEQSIFNYVIHKDTNFNMTGCYDMTNIVELFAANKDALPNKTLYHFCGFDNTMTSKYSVMKKFYDQYTR